MYTCNIRYMFLYICYYYTTYIINLVIFKKNIKYYNNYIYIYRMIIHLQFYFIFQFSLQIKCNFLVHILLFFTQIYLNLNVD